MNYTTYGNPETVPYWRKETPTMVEGGALDKQIGGNHYKKFKIQPAEFCHLNKIPYLEATAIKYLCRWRDKGGFEDLDKAIHFIELLKDLERTPNDNPEHWSTTGKDPF